MELSPEQQAAVDSDAPLIVVESVAGSGKTRVLIARILRLLRDGVPPDSIVAITYTQKAAQEMQERLGTVRLGYCGTLHSYCLRIVRENHQVLNLPQSLSVVDDSLKEQVLAEAVAEQDYKGTQVAVAKVLAEGYYAPPVLVKKKEHNVAKCYWQKMREGGLLDFDMILHFAIEALVHRRAITNCRHLLVDEVQDASYLDYQVYVALNCDKFIVGDGRQSIFGFRGGDAVWMRKLAQPPAQKLSLTGCYRCGSEIIAAANALIRHDEAHHEDAISLTGTTGSVTVAQFQSEREELDAIAGVLLKNCQTEEEFSGCAVLVRYNALVTRFCDGLRARGIPVAAKQQSTVPKDWGLATALVSFIGNPENDRLALAYVEARYGKEVAWRAKKAACSEMSSVWEHWSKEFPLIAVELRQQGPGMIGWILNECHVSPKSQSLLLPLLDRCSTPNELLLLAHEAVQQDTVEGHGVVVCTLHSFKGREASTIIMPAFEEGIMPGRNEDEVPELRRLAYVGMTRAKEHLVLTHCRQRPALYGYAVEAMGPSRFLDEAGIK